MDRLVIKRRRFALPTPFPYVKAAKRHLSSVSGFLLFRANAQVGGRMDVIGTNLFQLLDSGFISQLDDKVHFVRGQFPFWNESRLQLRFAGSSHERKPHTRARNNGEENFHAHSTAIW